ncbi:MAG: transcriptional repressor LexA [Candidatus Dojkabacteria bacterium]|nr:MAG: transcriptional repressor LexA [Candidatus Dojkabacteria bacterium]
MEVALTKKQAEVLDLIKHKFDQDGTAPSLNEMMGELGLSTKKSVAFHLDALERKGYIVRNGRARGIKLLGDLAGDFITVPLMGFANAGEPLMTAEDEYLGELTVDRSLLKSSRKVFGVELRGDSMDRKKMNGVHMRNGNYAIIAKDAEVRNGDVVLAVINHGATVKTFKRDGKVVTLFPESTNPIHKPIYVDNENSTYIAGKVITVLNNPVNEKSENMGDSKIGSLRKLNS